MPLGVNELSNIAGVTALSVSALRGCFNGFILLYNASCAGCDLSTIRVMIQCEQHKLEIWTDEVGLVEHPPTLHVNSNDTAQIAPILNQLELLLTDRSEMKSAYGLDIEVTSQAQHSSPLEAPDPSIASPWIQQFSSNASKYLQEGQTQWRKLRWVSVDEGRVHKLLDRVRYFVGELQHYLDRARRARQQNLVEIMYRTVVSNSTNQQYLSIASEKQDPIGLGSAINAAARLRQKGLILGLLEGSSFDGIEMGSLPLSRQPPDSTTRAYPRLNSGSLTSMRLSKRNLRLAAPLSQRVLRQLAYYDSKLVLLEWRIVEGDTYQTAKSRVNKISHFLHELLDPSFHSLQCIGFLEDPGMRRYGFVLDMPSALRSIQHMQKALGRDEARSLPFSIISLRNLFDTTACPSLNVRMRIAITILETILQLHTSGWLHKALRSDNVVMFQPVASKPHDLSQAQMLLIGYTYARLDDPAESTEPSPLQVDAELYRHPLSLGTARTRYCMCFDVFSIGCMLLELGLWASLSSTLVSEEASNTSTGRKEPQVRAVDLMCAKQQFVSGITRIDAAREDLAGSVMKRVEAAAGEAYASVVMSCLRAAHDAADVLGRGEKDYVLKLENESLVRLRWIAENI
jgi:hypothetical protein